MDATARALEKEALKWLNKLKKELKESTPEAKTDAVRAELENMYAYIKDCSHFLEKKDFVRAFEAVIYAWGIYETLKRCGLIKNKSDY